jgi:RHS repeat-associated protein
VPGVDPTQYSYDSHGRLTAVVQGTRTETFAYDTQGNLASVTDPLSQTTSFAYDPDGRVTTQTFPDGSQVQYAYDAAGNLTSLTPPGRPASTFTYTAADQLQSATAPAAGSGPATTTNTYDGADRLSQVMLPDGSAVSFNFNGSAGPGLLSTVTLPQGQETFAYATVKDYAPSPNDYLLPLAGSTAQVRSISGPGGEQLAFKYLVAQLQGATWSGPVAGSVSWTLDNNFRLASEAVNGGNPVNFQYDKDGLLTQAGNLRLTYDPHNGQLTGTSLGTVTDTIGYDTFGNLNTYQASAGSTSLYAVQDTSDALNRISQHTETIGGVTHTYAYTYDANGRLTQVTQDGNTVAQYTYDANGNRLTFNDSNGQGSATYDAQDRLLTYGTNTYTYTANGYLASKTDTATHQTTSYTYDALGNLTHVTLPNGTAIDYIVDGTGNRIGKKVNGTLVQGFLYDGTRLVAELDGSGHVVSQFVYGTSGVTPEYMIKGGVEYRIIMDERGSVRLVVKATTGQVAQQLSYDAFGNVTQDTSPGFQPFGFAGGLYDRDTGLVRFGARDYDAQTGRWTAKDPLLFGGGQANLYAYAGNDPVNYSDPTGLDPCSGLTNTGIHVSSGLTQTGIRASSALPQITAQAVEGSVEARVFNSEFVKAFNELLRAAGGSFSFLEGKAPLFEEAYNIATQIAKRAAGLTGVFTDFIIDPFATGIIQQPVGPNTVT